MNLFILFMFSVLISVNCYTSLFETKKFKVGIEYDKSLPMYGGSDRYRHRNNYDPFFVTITAKAKNGYVISYLEVSATVDAAGEVDFHVVRGSTGSKSIVFQLVSNHSDFLSYNYLAFGIREEEYKKMSNIISVPLKPVQNNGIVLQTNNFIIFTLLLPFIICTLSIKLY